jgi:holo-[acyl-carrier protein] synthase
VTVVGLGIDVASIERIAGVLERFGERFARRVLTAGEQRDLAARVADRATALAGRFAAKEAAYKALGGPRDVGWHHLEVRRGTRGAPELVLHGPAEAHALRIGATRSHISITHDAGVACSVVLLENVGVPA